VQRRHMTAWVAAFSMATAGAVPAFAQNQDGWTGSAQFGQMSLARGQTARLSIVAVGASKEVPPSPCLATLSFVDAGGKPFVDANGRPIGTPPVELVPGQAVFLDLPAAAAFGQSAARRVAFQAGGSITGAVDAELSCPKPVATLEVFDVLSGRTEVIGSISPDLFPESPVLIIDPELMPLGMMGVARGQTARISVVPVTGRTWWPPNPCAATLGFVDAMGQVITDANGIPIAAVFEGKTIEIDLRGADAFRGSQAMRRGIRPVVSIAGAVEPDLSCARPIVTIEVFDALTGRTQVLKIVHPEL
jgi:hypothetical protein